MNAVEYDLTYSMTPAESAAYSELVAHIARYFDGRISQCEYKITVEYPALDNSTTYRIHNIETAAKIIARSRAGNCPVYARVTYRADIQAERAASLRWKRYFRYATLSDYINEQGS